MKNLIITAVVLALGVNRAASGDASTDQKLRDTIDQLNVVAEQYEKVVIELNAMHAVLKDAVIAFNRSERSGGHVPKAG